MEDRQIPQADLIKKFVHTIFWTNWESTGKKLGIKINTGNMRKIKILFVCHGNICRSTMAQSIFTHLVHRQHLDAVFEIDSAATSREEIGNPPHYGTKNKLYEEHIPLIPHRARQMTRDDYLYYDLLIGMNF